jgi:hypothetical protein
MTVHHTKIKQAIAIGCHLSEDENRHYRIFWPQRSVEMFSNSIDEALHEMRIAQKILTEFPDYKFVNTSRGTSLILANALTEEIMVGTPTLPSFILGVLEAGEDCWTHPDKELPKPNPANDRINGIPEDGAVAYKEGVPAGDCPYLEDSDDFSRWNNEWDEEADKASLPPVKGSVVTNRYRAIYSEYGHPTHCGDELAILLNNLCLNKAGVNIELFEEICVANGVSLMHYDRTSRGWQGRLRMTGRNLLAKRVKNAKGKVLMPNGMAPDSYQLSHDWLIQAEQKYKPKNG